MAIPVTPDTKTQILSLYPKSYGTLVTLAELTEAVKGVPTPVITVPTFQQVADASRLNPAIPVVVDANFSYRSTTNPTSLNVQGAEQTGFAPGSGPVPIPRQIYAIGEEGFSDKEGNLRGDKQVVNINTTQIQNLNTSLVNILPIAPNGSYYNIKEIFVEYTHVTTAYTVAAGAYLRFSGAADINLNANIATQTQNQVAKLVPSPSQAVSTVPAYSALEVSAGLDIELVGGDYITGDGTIRVIVYYNTRTFGA